MRVVVRKLEIPDVGQLQSLVIEHLDGIEPGLTVLDSRLLLGHATVDIVALDADGTLVLVTAGFTADEDMLLKAVEAYSWCLEYSDAIRRLYPSVDVSVARPPRLMFVVERLPDSFHRKIKQLGFSEVDCVEFRHLDVSGTPAVYFDTLARLRRGSTLAEFQPAPIARRVSEPQMRRAPEPMITERPVDKLVDHSDKKVVPLVTGASSARATSVRLQKMLNTNGVSHGNGGAPVIDIAARTAVSMPRLEPPTPSVEIGAPSPEALRIEAPTDRVETLNRAVEAPTLEIELPQVETQIVDEEPLELAEDVIEAARAEIAAPAIEEVPSAEAAAPELESPAPEPEAPVASVEPIARVALRDAIAAPAPVTVATPAAQNPEPRVSFAEIAKELLGALASAPTPSPASSDAAEVAPAAAPEDNRSEPQAEASAATVIEEDSVEPVVAAPPVVEKPAPVVAAPPKSAFTAPKPVAPAPKPVAPVIKPIAPATKPIAPATKPIAPAAKPIAPAPRPAVAAPKPAAAVPKPAAAAPKPVAAEATSAPTAATETPAQPVPQEFEGLKFPNDGVLTRQWMEFLNQMASSK
jgi:hypothetical protein